MNIVYASNDLYVQHLAVSMYSLLDRNQVAEQVRIFVLSVDISRENQGKLNQIARRFARELVFLPLGDLREKFPYKVDTGGFDISAMGRLFIGTMLPKEVEQVIYLDCDTVVLSSLKGLWNTDLKGKLFGAVMEPTIYPKVKERIGLSEKSPYFNSGVLLIDVKQWREKEAEKQVVEFYGRLGGESFACDQDTLNGTFHGQIKTLSPRYNFFSNYRYFHYKDLVHQSEAYRVVPKSLFEQAKKHPAIIHYAGDERPWKAGNLGHYRLAYEQYLAMTPWKGAEKEEKKGQRLYLFAYHIMDYLTWIYPPARRWISSRFGMQVVENRKKETKNKQEKINNK